MAAAAAAAQGQPHAKDVDRDGIARVAERAIATFEADGYTDRALMWRAIHAILGDIAAKRFDPYAPIAIH